MKTRAAARRTNHKILREIAMYRDLIHKAAARNKEKYSQDDQGGIFDQGRNATTLSRLLKARRDLVGQGLDPAERLRQALGKLEVEWVEFQNLMEQTSKLNYDK